MSLRRARRSSLFLHTLEERITPDGKWDLGREHLSNQIIVRLKPNVQPPASLGAESLGLANLYTVPVPEGRTVEQTLNEFTAKGYVAYAEPDYLTFPHATTDDPSFVDGSLWGLHNTGQNGGVNDADIDAPEAWDILHDAEDVVVAVIDTGVDYNHPDLAANIWTNPGEIAGDGLDNDRNGFVDDVHGYDFMPNAADLTQTDSDPMDERGHGTHVAGTIGAVGNNGVGVTGVAWKVQIMVVKIFAATGSTPESVQIAGLNYAVKNGAKLSNNSYGGFGFGQAHFDAIAAAGKKGMLFVASAGNDTNNNDLNAANPGSYDLDNIVSVASLTRTDALSSFSNFGALTVDLGAPGSEITSTWPEALGVGLYRTINGTSMASPHVTGALALLKQQQPKWTNAQLKEHLLATTVPIAALTGRSTSGGRLNLANLLGEDPLPKVVSINAMPNADGSLAKIRLKFNVPMERKTMNSKAFKLTGPDGANIVVQKVRAVGATGRDWEVSFRAQRFGASAGVRVIVLPTVKGTTGLLDQDGDGTGGEVGQDQFIGTTFVYEGVGGGIADTGTTNFPLVVSNTFTVRDVNVEVTLDHPYMGDLTLQLVSPAGTIIPLAQNFGAMDNGFQNTWFDDQAAQRILTGVKAPFKGTFQPTIGLLTLNGSAAAGTWNLRVVDAGTGTFGSVVNWRLSLTTDTAHAAPTVTNAQFVTGDAAWPEGVQIDFNVPIMASSVSAKDITILGPGKRRQKVKSFFSTGGATSTRFIALLNPMLKPGVFNVKVGPALADVWGASLDGTSNLVFAEKTDAIVRTLTTTETVFQARTVPVAIQDGTGTFANPVPQTTLATLNVRNALDIANLRVSLDISHTYVNDLKITLISPAGTEVVLINRRGADNTRDMRRTIFSDAATTHISVAAAPFTGSFRPESALSAFDGETTRGTWTLKMEDFFPADTGTLLAWALYVETPPV